ncbi:MAG: VCBS repeat-containing protein, partial [Anaerolineales bacterium]|nr:VCBS repeat-containing protein [Anaerolineales bacterium]
MFYQIGSVDQFANQDSAGILQDDQAQPSAPTAGIIDLDTVASWFASDGCNANRLTWGDLEGDGDLDLAAQCSTDSGNVIRIYLNEGQALQTSASWESDLGCHSPAWGDLDGDGDLDLAVRCPAPRVYLNQAGSLQALASWNPISIGSGPTAWGDMDGNGYLDLAVGQVIYTNTTGTLSNVPSWTSAYTSTHTHSIGWADMDQDGDLDFAASTDDGYIRVYRNTSGMLGTSPTWQKILWPKCLQIEWGDMSGDGYPELACSGTNLMLEYTYVYSNSAGALSVSSYWQSHENHMGFAVDWGDVDGDGDLDLAVGNSGDNPERIYLNTGSELLTTTVWETSYYVAIYSLAWGDVDGDGDLDLAVAANPPRLHLNRSKSLQPIAVQSLTSDIYDRFYVAWGDVENDGDLDLVVGVSQRTSNSGWEGSSNIKLYINQAGTLQTPPAQNISLAKDIADVAWGDMDGDGYLDLAVGIAGKPNLVYRNNIGSLDTAPAWTAAITLTTTSMAWGDMDGDGDLDLAVGSNGGNRLHLNQAGTLEDTAAWSSADSLNTQCVSWGDVDGDGDLDLAAANRDSANGVYQNINGSLRPSPGWNSTEKDASHTVAWGDVDGDGDLDLAVGNHDQPIKLYMNQGGSLEATASWMGWHADAVFGLAWGDIDGDGDLDLATAGAGGWYGNLPSPDRVYFNQGGSLQNTEESIWTSFETLNSTDVACGDLDGDGDLDLVSGPRIYRNQRSGPILYPQKTESLALGLHSDLVPTFNQPASALATADYYALPGIRDSGTIPVSYTLFNPSGLPVDGLRAMYSKDGGDNWQEAIAAPGTQITLLGASTYPTPTVTSTHVYTWDVYNSGLFGRSDDIVLRLEAYPVSCCDGPVGSHQYTNQVAGPYQRPHYAAIQTFPFRVRGAQIRVMQDGSPAQGAQVYRILAGQTRGSAISDNAGRAYLTDALGYLQGRGELKTGDQLIALSPAEVTDRYTLYYTNATPTQTGLQAYTVPSPIGGLQTLVVSDT